MIPHDVLRVPFGLAAVQGRTYPGLRKDLTQPSCRPADDVQDLFQGRLLLGRPGGKLQEFTHCTKARLKSQGGGLFLDFAFEACLWGHTRRPTTEALRREAISGLPQSLQVFFGSRLRLIC